MTTQNTKAAHTPGPWQVAIGGSGDSPTFGVRIWPAPASVVSLPDCGTLEEMTANARLIAQAPALLEELRAVLEWARTERAPLREQEIKSICAAIAAATGEA